MTQVPGSTSATDTRGAEPGSAVNNQTLEAAARTVRVQACGVSQLTEGCGRLVVAAGKPLAVFVSGGRIIAIDAECPHEGGPLQEGTIEDGCVVCPWHAYRFDMKSGRCVTDENLGVKTYPTSIEDGTVWVEVPT